MEWKSEIRLLSDLLPNSQNPRRMSKNTAEDLAKSLSKFGVCSPIQINTDGKIIGGHQRAKILQQLGIKEVEVKVPDRELTKRESDQLNIMLNKVHGDFDDDMLANKSLKRTMTLKFKEPEHLEEAQSAIAMIVDCYPGATHKVKV